MLRSGYLWLALLLPGCGWDLIADRASNPLLEVNIGGSWFTPRHYVQTVTDAGRRIVIVRLARTLASGERISEHVCAEPSPDVMQAYANVVSASAKPGASANAANLEFARAFTTAAAPLLYRSQGLQYFRDSMFNLCIMHGNNVLDDQTYRDLLMKTLDNTATMVTAEMKAVEEAAKRAQATVKPDPPVLPTRPASGG